MRKEIGVVILMFFSIELNGCTLKELVKALGDDNVRTIIQSIPYGNKKIEVYTLNYGNFTTETIHVSIISWYSKYTRPTRIFEAIHRSQKINIRLSIEEETSILEIFYHNIRADEIRLKKEFVDGIKVVYIEVDKNYDFIGYKP